jgi:hypothetical protein
LTGSLVRFVPLRGKEVPDRIEPGPELEARHGRAATNGTDAVHGHEVGLRPPRRWSTCSDAWLPVRPCLSASAFELDTGFTHRLGEPHAFLAQGAIASLSLMWSAVVPVLDSDLERRVVADAAGWLVSVRRGLVCTCPSRPGAARSSADFALFLARARAPGTPAVRWDPSPAGVGDPHPAQPPDCPGAVFWSAPAGA